VNPDSHYCKAGFDPLLPFGGRFSIAKCWRSAC